MFSSSSENRRVAKSLLMYPIKKQEWDGYSLIPPGSVLDNVVRKFERRTDIALELPFILTMQLLLTHLVRRNIRVKITSIEKPLECDIFIIAVADSCSGKTFTKDIILNAMGDAGRHDLVWDFGGAFRAEVNCPARIMGGTGV